MASHEADSLLLEDFGQKVDLTRRIREVLVNYPEGTTVLKELIQNADDAGATKVCLCLDRRVHGVESLLSDKLAEWQGPALLAFNDAEFTEDDFTSISRIGGSKKQGQAWKTGRFGVGFNSVYHLTDLPSFVSGKYVVLFDPQGVYLPNISVANPGKRIEYVSSSAVSIYNDQFIPYCAFGCDMKQPFHGTLFRFPLRNSDQGAISKLSRQAYAEDDIYSMFAQLYKEGIFTLLFLKSVLSVEMYTWDAGAPEPRKLYSCCVSSANDDIIWHRQALRRLSNSVMSANNEVDSFSLDFLSEAVLGTQLEKKTVTFFIAQAMASGSSKIGAFAAAAVEEYDIHLLPWASVAACISDGSLEGNKDWAKYRRNGLPMWPELLEIFSDSSARGDRGLSQATVVTPTSTNLEFDDDLHDTDNDDSDACTGTPNGSAPPKRRLDRPPTDRRRKSHTRTLTNSAEDFRTFVRWRMEKGSTSATSAVTRPPDPIVDGPYSMISCQKLLDSLEDIPTDLYVLAQLKIHSDPGWRMSFVEVRPDRRLWMLHGLKE